MHEISNNVVCATSKGSGQPAHTSVKLQTEHHLEFLRLTGGCTGSSELLTFQFNIFILSLVYMHNLHPGANLLPVQNCTRE